jgi:hypothetical protein
MSAGDMVKNTYSCSISIGCPAIVDRGATREFPLCKRRRHVSEFRADNPMATVKRHNCLHAVETRTNPLWHLWYAVRGES